MRCSRCGGSGYIHEYRNVEGGICFACMGSGENKSTAESQELSKKKKPSPTKNSSVLPENEWEIIARTGGIPKCLELLEKCKLSVLLSKETKPSYDSTMQIINSCYIIIDKLTKNQSAESDLDRLFIRVSNLSSKYIKE